MDTGEKRTRGSMRLDTYKETQSGVGEQFRREQQIRYRRPTQLPGQVFDWLDTKRGYLPYILLGIVVFLWLISLPLIDLRAMTDIGLLSVLPITYYIALYLLTVSFCLLVFDQFTRTRMLLAHLVALIAIIHSTPAILYGTLRYSWAWKHMGMVDYIQRYGSINPDISFLNAYHNWPGFFALNTLLTDLAGLESPHVYAIWAPVFFNLLFLGSLLLIFRSLSMDNRLVWMAVWFFYLTNWVGQDYFAPQAFAYFFYLVILGIILGWFRSWGLVDAGKIRRWLRHPRLSELAYSILQRSASTAVVQQSTPAQRVILVSTSVLLMAVMTFSHQLTPFMMLGALALLALFQLTYLRRLPVLMGVLTAAWILFVATPFVRDNLRSLVSSFGAVDSNIGENLISLSSASTGQVVVSLMGRALTLLVILLAGVGFFRRLRNGHFDLTAALLVAAPFFMLLANSYGGEILFRVYFFALPFMAFLIAGLIYPRPEAGWSWFTPVIAAGLSVVLLTGFLFGYFGKERQYYFSPGEVAATKYLLETAPPGSLIIEGTRNYPSLFRNYEQFTYVPISREPVDNRQEIVADPEAVLSRWMENMEYPAAYFLITRSMKAEVDMVGTIPAGSLDRIEETLKQSDRFQVLYSDPDATIFILRNRE